MQEIALRNPRVAQPRRAFTALCQFGLCQGTASAVPHLGQKKVPALAAGGRAGLQACEPRVDGAGFSPGFHTKDLQRTAEPSILTRSRIACTLAAPRNAAG